MSPLVGLALVLLGGGQREPGLTRTAVRAPQSDTLVTRTEARVVFVRTEAVIRRALGLGGGGGSPLTAADRPVTRAEVVGELARLYAIVAPSAKLTPRAVKFEVARLRMAGPRRDDLVRLVRLGAVAPVGPVAAGPKDGLTVDEFGDAIGFFLSRMAEITHTPSRKWTPALRDE